MKFLEAKDRSLSQVLVDNRFKIDSFQREYRWQRKHIEALISDLATNFEKYYKDGDTVETYADYGSYYMGPIVLCDDGKELSIVDGQQRLTSFTLLLIFIHHAQINQNIKDDSLVDIKKYLYVRKGGKTTLVLNVETRTSIIENLIQDPENTFSEIDELVNDVSKKTKDESIQNIIERYEDITKLFPDNLNTSEKLPIFIEWLLNNVILVEIKAFSMESAYTIFETMNDRGMSLNPTEILKGYLLSMIDDENKAEEMNEFWKERVFDIKSIIGPDSDLEFFRNWLRAKYAESKRATMKGAENLDFEQIGTQFHSWVKNNSNRMFLHKPNDFYLFIRSDFDFYSDLYLKIFSLRNKSTYYHDDLYITTYYTIADSLAYPLFLSPISKIDDAEMIDKKLKIVNKFIDIYTNFRSLQSKTITQSTIRNFIYDLIKEIRNLDYNELYDVLSRKVDEITDSRQFQFLRLHFMDNWGYYHYFYARILYYFIKDNDEDFEFLLRSRKQSSLILVRIFEENDLKDFEQDQLFYQRLYSVANHILIRRNTHLDFIKLNAEEKIQFLHINYFLPEMNVESSIHPYEFLEQREFKLRETIDEIWNFRNI